MKATLLTSTVLIVISLYANQHVNAQSDIPKVANTYVLENVTVVSEPGQMSEGVNMLIEDGLIKTIGTRIPFPTYAKVIDCSGLYAYAGFIEGLSHTGVPKVESDDQPRVKNPGSPPNDRAGILPERSVMEVIQSGSKSISDKRKLGFTASHVVPRGGMLPGQGAILLLGEGQADELLIKKDVSLFAQFAPARRMYPATAIGIMAKWKELYRQAEYVNSYKAEYDNPDNSGLTRPKYDRALEGMFPVVSENRPVFFSTPDAMDIYKAQLLEEELGFNLILAEAKETWYVSESLSESSNPVVLSMDLPDDKSDTKKDADDDEEATNEETEQLKKRREESFKKHMSQAATVAATGAPIAFSTLETKPKDFHSNVLKMIEHGLTEDQALAALTTTPAAMFGLSSYLGTVDAGKMANLVLSRGPYFHEDAQVKYVFVEGAMFEYEIKEKKKKSESSDDVADASISGKWSFEIDIPGDEQSGTITFKGSDGDYSGVIRSDSDDDEDELYNIVVSGATVTFMLDIEQDGQTLPVEFELTVEDDLFEGDVIADPIGTFSIEGERIPN